MWGHRIFILLVVGLCSAAASPAMADLPGISEPLTAGQQRHVYLTNLATDSAPAFQTCDPNSPQVGFAGQNLGFAAVPGFSGTVYQGDVTNRCNVAASDIRMAALFLDSGGDLLGAATFEPNFSVLAPGASSPFLAISPLPPSQVAKVLPVVLGFTPVTGALPILTLKLGTPSVISSGVNVPYEVRNSGSVPAGLPRVAGRLFGRGCTAAFAVDFVAEGSPIPAGGSASGDLSISDTCGGVPTMEVGSDSALTSGLPAGLSFASARSLYTPDGALHVIANVCNNSSQDAFFPEFRAVFSGPFGHPTFALSGTGIYSGNSCAPLLATVPGAPAELTFESLVPPSSLSAALTGDAPRRDPRTEVWKKLRRHCTPAELAMLMELSEHFRNPSSASPPQPTLSADCRYALTLLRYLGPNFLLTAAAEEDDPPLLLTFAYNNTEGDLPSSDYRVQSLGFAADGSVIAAVDVANPPSLSPHGWGIGVTPLDTASVIAGTGDAFRIQGEGSAIPK